MRKWKSTKNHWSNKPKAERQEILKGISKGWGRKPITKVDKICPQCGNTFKVKKSTVDVRKHCSKKCFNESKKGVIPKNIKIAQANSPIKEGEKNLNWKGGITPYPKEWTGSLHHQVWVRDKNTCQKCGKKGIKRTDLIVHHKDFTKKNCGIDNLILFCRSCHMKIHWQANSGVPGLKNWDSSKSLLTKLI